MTTVVQMRPYDTLIRGLGEFEEPATFYFIVHWEGAKRIIHCVRCHAHAPRPGQAALEHYCSTVSAGQILGGGYIHIYPKKVIIAGMNRQYGKEADREATTARAFGMHFFGRGIIVAAA